ncbi:MAG: ABC transporter permease [Planctomycetaceae bacterium]|nr:ABC transporter permease [Planctomycetaceae bacterium]
MNFSIILRIAGRALGKHKMRAGLTIFGMAIGIAAVTTMVSIGMSANSLVQSQFEGLGTNVIIVFPGNSQHQGVVEANISLTWRDSDAIARECPSVLASSPLIGTRGQVIYGGANFSPEEMHGVSSDYLTVRNWSLSRGQFFTERDVISANKVCVIGHTLVARLFQTTNPVGAMIRIKNIPFRVVGVLEKKGANMVGQDQDNIVLMPFTTVRKRLQSTGFDNVHAIMASARSMQLMADAQNEMEQLLAERHQIYPGEPRDYLVQNTTEIANVFGIVTGTLTLMLASIAGISLVVGGVGVMNVMLMSVTERTREIGLRMAVGARSRDILRQFLVEAVMLSMLGGMIGFGLGIAASIAGVALINAFTTGAKWQSEVSLTAAVVAIVFAATVGVFFGYYPARRASQLDPIEALRYE